MGWGLGLGGGATAGTPACVQIDLRDLGTEVESQAFCTPLLRLSCPPRNVGPLGPQENGDFEETSPPALTQCPAMAEPVTHIMLFNLCKNTKRLADLLIISILQMRRVSPREVRG